MWWHWCPLQLQLVAHWPLSVVQVTRDCAVIVSLRKKKRKMQTFNDLARAEENDTKLLAEINNFIDLPENEVDQTTTLVSSPIILQGDPPKKPKKLKRRKKKHSKKLPTNVENTASIYADFEQKGTIF